MSLCELKTTDVPGVLWCPACQTNTASTETNPARHRRTCRKATPQEPGALPVKPCGPGCQLRKLLKEMGFTESNCSCAAMAAKMDKWGPAGCRELEHFAEIVAHLEKEAAKTGKEYQRSDIEFVVGVAIALASSRSDDQPSP